MITFILSILLLVAAYFVYGKLVERYLDVDPSRKTPAYEKGDGVDFQPLPTWKVFIIQFLNIAGLGPIFGAVTGAAFGPAAYIWIVVGCIFMGAVHDFFAGMMSIHNGGVNMPDITAKYLGNRMKGVMNFVVIFLLMAVGVSFVIGPSGLLQNLTGVSKEVWLYVIFGYYILATLLPVDKIIGSVYPYMGAVLLFMALGVGVMMVVGDLKGTHEMVELTPSVLKNWHSDPGSNMIFPMMFIVISCGAISGFHATQSPMMARCLKNEKHARPVFYGAMIAEGIVAMVWATAAMAYFGGPEGLNAAMTDAGTMVNGELVRNLQAADIVDMICRSWLGKVGAVIAILGVVICPVTSGDTAFRSLRLSLSDMFHYAQNSEAPCGMSSDIRDRILLLQGGFLYSLELSRNRKPDTGFHRPLDRSSISYKERKSALDVLSSCNFPYIHLCKFPCCGPSGSWSGSDCRLHRRSGRGTASVRILHGIRQEGCQARLKTRPYTSCG